MTFDALPWFLLVLALLVLIAAVIALRLGDRDLDKAEAENQRLLQQQRIDQADLAEARRLVHRTRGERDLARDTVRDLLDMHREAGLRLSRPAPLPMPPDLDDALTAEFTRVVERNTWPEWPDNGGRS